MWAQLFILSTLIFTQPNISFLQDNYNFQHIVADTSCKTETDSLTKRFVYTTADISPTNEGGQIALMSKIDQITIMDVPKNYDSNFIVAFIVDVDGSIKGERIIKDCTNTVGQQMLEIVKALKWTPAKCNSKNVAMLNRLSIIIDVAEQ